MKAAFYHPVTAITFALIAMLMVVFIVEFGKMAGWLEGAFMLSVPAAAIVRAVHGWPGR